MAAAAPASDAMLVATKAIATLLRKEIDMFFLRRGYKLRKLNPDQARSIEA
jgi:hypothetical protein